MKYMHKNAPLIKAFLAGSRMVGVELEHSSPFERIANSNRIFGGQSVDDMDHGVGGGGGPLIVLQAAAVLDWQGASDYENSLMAGGDIETDYDLICCDGQPPKGVFVLTRYGREMLVLWMGAFGGRLLPPLSLYLQSDTIVLTQSYADNDLPEVLPRIQERVHRGKPDRSLLLNVQDTTLRLHAGADSLQVVFDGVEPSYNHGYIDISVTPGLKRCDVYEVDMGTYKDEFLIISAHRAN